jgi:hypothetical protein
MIMFYFRFGKVQFVQSISERFLNIKKADSIYRILI